MSCRLCRRRATSIASRRVASRLRVDRENCRGSSCAPPISEFDHLEWVNAIVQGVLLGGLYALFAAGLSLIFGIMRLVNIAHGDLIVATAYLSYFVIELLGIGPFTSLIIVIPIAAIVGYVLQRALLNWTLGDDLPPLLVTLGLSVIIQNGLLMAFTADGRKLDGGSIEVASWKL